MRAQPFHRRRTISVVLGALLCLSALLRVPATHAASASVDVIRFRAGDTVTVRGSGFASGEQIVTWASSADGDEYETVSATANRNGDVSFQLKTRRFWEAGWWAITLHGTVSELQAVARYQLDVAPPNGSLGIDRPTVAVGSRVNFKGEGFIPDEPISVWATQPNGTAISFPVVIGRDAGTIYFAFDVPATAQVGRWSMTAYGGMSDRMLIVDFVVTR